MKGKMRGILLMLCICAIVVIPFREVHRSEFTNWDDQINVTENPHLFAGFKTGLKPLLFKGYQGLYVPVTYAVFWAQNHLWGLNASYFHLVNLVFHVVSVAIVYLILWKLLSSMVLASAAALWWGVHPMHVEAVAWVTGLKDVLSTLFMLLSLLLYVVWREKNPEAAKKKRSGFLWVISLVVFLLSCLSKPGSVAFPAVLVGYDLIVGRRKWKALLASVPYFVISILIVVITMKVQNAEEGNVVVPDILGRLRVAADSTVFYLQKAFWPSGLCAVHDRTVTAVVKSPWSWLALLFVAGICAVIIWRKETWGWGIVVFLAGFAPVSGLVPYGYQRYATVADRYVYFSLVGLAFIFGKIISRVGVGSAKRLNKWGGVGVGCLVLWALVLSLVTDKQTAVWHDSLALWNRAIVINPKAAVARNNRGFVWGKKKEYDKEIEDCTRAIELYPEYSRAYNNRGAAWSEKGFYNKEFYEKAIEDYTQAIKFNENYADAYTNRGIVWGLLGQQEKEIEDYTRALTLKMAMEGTVSGMVDTINNRGVAYETMGDYDSALSDFDAVIKYRPDYAMAYHNRASVWQKKGAYDKALQDCATAIRLAPEKAAASYRSRALIWRDKQDYQRTIEDYGKAIELNEREYREKVDSDKRRADELRKNLASDYNNRGNARGSIRNFERAINDYNRAIGFNPDYAEAYNNRAVSYYFLGKYDKAMEDVKTCSKLGGPIPPDFLEALKERIQSTTDTLIDDPNQAK